MNGRGVLWAVAAVFCLWAAPASAACVMADADAAWLTQALRNWRVAEREALKLKPASLPDIVAIDAACTYTATPSGRDTLRWRAVEHRGTVRFPDGKTQAVGPLSFASPLPGRARGYFAMALPSVWRAAGVKSDLGLERLMDGVMLHEFMHTRQFYFVNRLLDDLTARFKLPDSIGDDSLQAAFEGNPAYAADYRAERDTLFAAAAAPTDEEARQLAAKALSLYRARHAKYFTGDNAKWAVLDGLFLDMEGLGQWMAYSFYIRSGLAPAAVLPAVRRDGKYWTQDEGLALFLTVDRLVPGWQKHAFAKEPALAEELLEMAATSR